MAPAGGRGRANARKPKKHTLREPSSSPERSPVRDSEYELQRKAKMAQNAERLGALEMDMLPARAQATSTKRRQRPR